MTNASDALESLRNLTADNIILEQQRAGRPYGRSPIIAFEGGYVAAMRTEDRANRFKQTVAQLGIDITGARVVKASTPQASGDFTLWVELPIVRSGTHAGELSDQPGYELNQMLVSARAASDHVQSILDLRGRTIDAAEAVYIRKYNKFVADPAGGKTRTRDGVEERGDYEEVAEDLYFYKVSKVTGTGTAAATPVAATPATMGLVTTYVMAQLGGVGEASLSDAKITRMALQAAGIDFSLAENAGVLEAVLTNKLPEFCGLKVTA